MDAHPGDGNRGLKIAGEDKGLGGLCIELIGPIEAVGLGYGYTQFVRQFYEVVLGIDIVDDFRTGRVGMGPVLLVTEKEHGGQIVGIVGDSVPGYRAILSAMQGGVG